MFGSPVPRRFLTYVPGMGYSSVISICFVEGRQNGSTLRPLIVMVFVLLALPCYAYDDPSGGALFQILTPVLAAIWGMWLIFANNTRQRESNLQLRGISSDQ
jgi:hypothetical protein